MRAFIAIVLLVAVGVGIAGFALGWFTFSTSPKEQNWDITLTVDPQQLKKDRNTVFGWFKFSTPPKDQKPDIKAADGRGEKARDEFQQQAETQLKAVDLSLDELKAKAKNGHAVTKDRMNQAIDDLTKKTEAARGELRELKTATHERWDALKTRLSASLEELTDGIERAFGRFMNEWTHAAHQCPFVWASVVNPFPCEYFIAC